MRVLRIFSKEDEGWLVGGDGRRELKGSQDFTVIRYTV
jgi:hypothetical protein